MRNDAFIQLTGPAEWAVFRSVAEAEGWRVPVREEELYRGPLADSALSLRTNGRFAGMVTFICHGSSGWIGNLIVVPEKRGRGYGARLFDEALRALRERGVVSVWLTASEAGLALYKKRGFVEVGAVERWALAAGGSGQGGEAATTDATAALRTADALAWGEKRPLLEYLLPHGRPLACGPSTVLLQREPGMQILGPWFGDDAGEDDHRRLLALSVAAANPGEELVADVLAGALPPQILLDAGFTLLGSTRLMVRGNASGIDLDRMVSFASLGSMG
jgi:ribosomal protein S18 acetylase RimI-like enzyme